MYLSDDELENSVELSIFPKSLQIARYEK